MSYLKRGIAVLLAAGLVTPAAFSHIERDASHRMHSEFQGTTRVIRLNMVINRNSTKTHITQLNWLRRITLGGVINVDGIVAQKGWNITGPATAGIIPNFRNSSEELINRASDISVTNANILLDAQVNRYVKVHLGAIYRDLLGPIQPVAGFDEAYVTVSNFYLSNFYFRVGKVYVPYGSYDDPYPLMPSVVQLLTQTNANAIQLGYGSAAHGLYGVVYGFNAPFSSVVHYADGNSYSSGNYYPRLPRSTRVRNFGAKIGYMSRYGRTRYDVEASYIKDFRDTAYFLANYYQLDNDYNYCGSDGLFRSVGAYELHAYLTRGPFDIGGDYTALVRRIDLTAPDDLNTRISAYIIKGGYRFNTYNMPSKVNLSYERAAHAVISALSGGGGNVGIETGIENFGRLLPRRRYSANYMVKLSPHTRLTLLYARSRDFRKLNPDDRRSLESDEYKARFGVEF